MNPQGRVVDIESFTDVSSWDSLVKTLGRFNQWSGWACRGEPDLFPTSHPSIDRMTERFRDNWQQRLTLEAVLLRRFIQDIPAHLEVYELSLLDGVIAPLMLMRHFGAPTRLLDWSESAWVAAYMAASDSGKMDKDGRILYFDRYQLEENVRSQFRDQPTELDSSTSRGSPKIFDVPTVTGSSWGTWLFCQYLMGLRFPRLIAQQGFFTVASKPYQDHWHLAKLMLQGEPGQGYGEIRIRHTAKPSILRGLASMGITAASLYPGREGICQSLMTYSQYCESDRGFNRIVDASGTSAPSPTAQDSHAEH